METQQLSEREQKAVAIAAHTQLVRNPNNTWIVPSQSGAKDYTVDPDPESPRCTCPDFEYRQLPCKHIYAVEIVLQRKVTVSNDGQTQIVTRHLQSRRNIRRSGPLTTKRRQTRRRTSLNSCISFAPASKNRSKPTDARDCRSRTLSLRRLTRLTRWSVRDALRAISVTHWRRATSQRCPLTIPSLTTSKWKRSRLISGR